MIPVTQLTAINKLYDDARRLGEVSVVTISEIRPHVVGAGDALAIEMTSWEEGRRPQQDPDVDRR